MYKTLLAVAAVVAFAVVGAMYYPTDKVVLVAKEQGYTLTVYDAQCRNEEVLEIYKSLGAPDEVLSAAKKAKVVNPEGVSQEACASKEGPMGEFPSSVYLVGKDGQKGYFPTGEMKPMKHDHPAPGQLGT